MAQFKVGDVVELVSGGPAMTVIQAHERDDGRVTYTTSWFAGKKNERGVFPEDALKASQHGTGAEK